jgi:uracil-DNA glycosylase
MQHPRTGTEVASGSSYSHSIIQKLDRYYRTKGIHPEDFQCGFMASCSKGCKRNFTEARASLVGGNYTGLVIISLDPGKGFPKIEDRTFEGVRVRQRESDPKKWRLHWRETNALIGFLLGRPAMDAFAHVNAAKCTQNKPGNSEADPHLFENCRGYLKRELSILQAKVIITQGLKAHAAFEPIANATQIGKDRSITADGALWIRSYHPGARTPYWEQKRMRWRVWRKWIQQVEL